MKPIVGITMGDAAGIGPEIIVKALLVKEIYEVCCPIVIGDSKVMEEAAKIVDADLRVNSAYKVKEAEFKFGIIDVFDLNNINLAALKIGQVDAMAGKAWR